MYWLIGGVCLVIGWLIGYGMGKPNALRELGRAELYARQRKIRAYRNRNKKPIQTYRGPSRKPIRGARSQSKKR